MTVGRRRRRRLSRGKTYHSVWLEPHQSAILHYYADRHARSLRDIVGRIVEHYALADVRFDPERFWTYVGRFLLAATKDGVPRDELEALSDHVERFIDAYGKRHGMHTDDQDAAIRSPGGEHSAAA